MLLGNLIETGIQCQGSHGLLPLKKVLQFFESFFVKEAFLLGIGVEALSQIVVVFVGNASNVVEDFEEDLGVVLDFVGNEGVEEE